MTETTGRRSVFMLIAALAVGAALAGCTNTVRGLEQDSRKIFGNLGNGTSAGDGRSGSTSKSGTRNDGTWKNPE